MKRSSALFLALCFIIPAYSQESDNTKTPPTAEEIGDKVYFETVLEDFESTQFTTEKNLKFSVTRNQKGELAIRDVYPAPVSNSKKYLGVKMFGKYGDVFKIIPEKELIINKYCRTLSLWVYGKRFAGEISLILQDAEKRNHRIIMGSTNFLGWRKMIVRLDSDIKQEDDYLSQKRSMKVMEIQYRPANRTVQPVWQFFYLDDLTAMVREKYTDRQSDDW